MKKKRILYIGNKLSIHGKTPTHIETLGPLLEKEGFVLQYASSKKAKILRLADMVFTTIRYSKETDYVIIDTYSTSNFWYAFAVSQLCRIINIPYIPILHGGNLPSRLHKNPLISQMIFKNAWRNIAPSGYLFEAFKNRNFAPLVHIPNMIILADYKFKRRDRISPNMLWVRSLASIYNPEMALLVLDSLRTKFPHATLCMVGPNNENLRTNLEAEAESMRLNVIFTGKLSKSEWLSRSENYDIFINTSHFDNSPVSILEAMALGLPVVSTNVGGIPYLLDHTKNAMLVNDNDVNAMVAAIVEILENRELSDRLIRNARASVDEFDWNSIKDKWNEILI